MQRQPNVTGLAMLMRRVPLEVIQCRHCDKSFQTSEKHLRNALLCQDCFGIREINRKGYPRVIHEKAEHNLGDRYGENRGSKVVVCAACGERYEVYKRLTDEFSRSCLEDAIKNNSLAYSDGPLNGWTNDILCKRCFDNVQLGFEDEIKLMNEHESERLLKNAQAKAAEEIRRRRSEDKIASESKGFGRFMLIIFLIFAIPMALTMCSGIGSGNKAPTDMYFRK